MSVENRFDKYFMQEDQVRMISAETFEQLVEVAIEILQRMPDEVGIVCGPITSGGVGSVEGNIDVFKNTISGLQMSGHPIFDQMPFESHLWRIKDSPYYDPTRNHLLEAFYGRLFLEEKISTFYFIPGWENSFGARWEHDQATALGKNIVYVNPFDSNTNTADIASNDAS